MSGHGRHGPGSVSGWTAEHLPKATAHGCVEYQQDGHIIDAEYIIDDKPPHISIHPWIMIDGGDSRCRQNTKYAQCQIAAEDEKAAGSESKCDRRVVYV
jgi:hypothetical protein